MASEGPALTGDERAELERLRAENAALRPGQQPHHVPWRPAPGHTNGKGQARSSSAGGSGSRRTSTSSRPRAWMRSSSP